MLCSAYLYDLFQLMISVNHQREGFFQAHSHYPLNFPIIFEADFRLKKRVRFWDESTVLTRFGVKTFLYRSRSRP